MKKTLLAATTFALALTGITPAMASDFSFVASKTQNLNYDGETIEVALNNVPAGQGVYVRLCAVVPTGRPTDCFGAGTWATTDAAALRMGAVPIVNGKVQLAVKGAFQTGGTSFGGQVTPLRNIDCSAVECAVHARRDHFGTADTSMDAWSPVTFGAAQLRGWTKANAETREVRIYAKHVVGAGKVQFMVNGREIAWVRAADRAQSKLRVANGDAYLVRTLTLEPGFNRVQILVDGKVVRSVAYNLG
jgi:hypothetical protein